jgi:hypothetical protein
MKKPLTGCQARSWWDPPAGSVFGFFPSFLVEMHEKKGAISAFSMENR